MSRFHRALFVALLGLLVEACSSDTPKKSLGDGCTLNSDCSGSLTCTFGRCHSACVISKDCPTGQSCVKNSDGNAVCQLPEEVQCKKDADCATPLTCGADGQCRGQCTKDSDCTTGQKCSTNNTCAEPSQVDSNNNLISSDGGVIAVGGSSGTGGSTSNAAATTVGGATAAGGTSSVGTATTAGGATSAGGASNAGGTSAASTTIAAGNSAIGGGSSAVGGASTSNTTTTAGTGGGATIGGATAAGGTSSSVDTTTPAGGATSAGGTISTGGSTGDNTNPAGGVTSAGGTSITGGAPAGSGVTSVGGTDAAGGVTNAGGITSTGGSQGVGGTVSTGGTSASGGITSAGGTIATGGTSVTGGTTAIGGAPTGGTIATGGSNTGGSTNGASYIPTGCSAPSTTTRYFCDDFESGVSKWSLSGQDWAPVTTTARSDSTSLTESPNGNYLNGENASATTSTSIDLTGATAPVLTFWHKLSLYCTRDYTRNSDYGDAVYVEATSDGGITWTQLSKLTNVSNSSTWNQQILGLSTFAGKKVKIRFRLGDNTGGDAATADGWTIDDVEVRETVISAPPNNSGGCGAATTTRYFCDAFEGGLDNWVLSGSDWNTTNASSAVSGSLSLTDSPGGNYLNSTIATATMAGVVNLTSASAPGLMFWHKLALDGTYITSASQEGTYVEASSDGGVTWTQLTSFTSGSNATTWSQRVLSLASYVGKSVMIRFRLVDNGYGAQYVADGWSIDHVEIAEL